MNKNFKNIQNITLLLDSYGKIVDFKG